MGQEHGRERPPCEEERSEWVAANTRYSIKDAELKKLTKGEKAVKDITIVTKLGVEVDKLKAEADAKLEKLNECMRRNATGEL
jgi:uncharacterized protein YgfB (UPF0149 family)